MSVSAHPLELAVALGLLAPHSLDREEAAPREPSESERQAAEVEFLLAAADLEARMEAVAP